METIRLRPAEVIVEQPHGQAEDDKRSHGRQAVEEVLDKLGVTPEKGIVPSQEHRYPLGEKLEVHNGNFEYSE